MHFAIVKHLSIRVLIVIQEMSVGAISRCGWFIHSKNSASICSLLSLESGVAADEYNTYFHTSGELFLFGGSHRTAGEICNVCLAMFVSTLVLYTWDDRCQLWAR